MLRNPFSSPKNLRIPARRACHRRSLTRQPAEAHHGVSQCLTRQPAEDQAPEVLPRNTAARWMARLCQNGDDSKGLARPQTWGRLWGVLRRVRKSSLAVVSRALASQLANLYVLGAAVQETWPSHGAAWAGRDLKGCANLSL